ncbi:APC family permease [Mycobacterium aquaticum]|uniref:APC family permease n=1 Tax=Mycobacterium aquaticum TaxID=1927124 RepID=UPI002481E901|nr:amino acid permease [Mycobacterium aquaticum]
MTTLLDRPAATTTATANDFCEESGYKAELKRSLSSFQMFAISFASVSVVIGIFATYSQVLKNSGPLGIWLFPIVAVGQILVALVFAQFAARIPLSGSSYQWASRLANPKIGWIFGWIAAWNIGLSPVAIDNALATQCLMPLFNMAPSETTGRVLTVVLLLIQAVIVIYSTRIVGWTNSLAVGVELAIVVVLGVALFAAVMLTGHGSTENLFSQGIATGSTNYFAIGGGLMAAMIMGLSTLVGFEASANMAEEAKDAHRTVPRAIVGSVVAAAILGMFLIVALTVAIRDMGAASNSASPVAEIMNQQFGPALERPLLLVIAIAFFGAALVTIAGTSRIVFAMARDERFPAHRMFSRVNPHTRTPIPATLLVLALGVVVMLVMPGGALIQLITAGAIFNNIPYALTIVLYLVVRKKLGRKEGAFSLGRFEVPVAVVALAWVFIAIFVVSVSEATVTTFLIIGGLVLSGAVYLGYLLKCRREVLEREPGTQQF